MRKLQMLFLSFSLILNMGVVNAGSDVPFTPTEEVVETLPVESESTEVIVETATSTPTPIEQNDEEVLPLNSMVETTDEESTTIETQSLKSETMQEEEESLPLVTQPAEVDEQDADNQLPSSETESKQEEGGSLPSETPVIEPEDKDTLDGSEPLEANQTQEFVDHGLPNEEDSEETTSNGIVSVTSAGKLMPPVVGLPLYNSGLLAANSSEESGVVLKKTAKLANEDDVKISLEAFVTGAVSTTTKAIPTDIVLVLDQSGSMAWTFGTGTQGSRIYDHSTAYEYRDNPGLVVRDGDNYYPLTVTRSGGQGNYSYIYSYVNTAGNTATFESLQNNQVFQADSTPKSRSQVLKEVVTTFVNNVQANAVENYVDHRISMVGFGSGSGWNLNYGNTEILTTLEGNPVNYRYANNTNYGESLMSVTAYRTRIQAAIDAIDAVGATRSDLGMEMATKVFANNPLNQGEERNRVVVMLTDGSPTSGSGFENAVANAAINYSRTLKNSTDSEGYGATVYTIGIFDGANPSGTSRENRYMNYVSSNYPNASNLNTPGVRVTEGNYYLTAQNQSDLENIFESISETISSPTIEAGEGTVVVDQLTPQLQLPAGFTADNVEVSVYSYTYHGLVPNYSSTSWEKDTSPPSSIDVTLNDDGRIEVTGFNYQENFVANDSSNGDPRGKKIVIEFTAKIKEDFIGGNQVLTNESNSGFYLPGERDATEVFEQPMIDVPLRLNIVGQDAGQYYGTQTPANQLILNNSKSYTIGSKEYEFDGKNNQYVNITYDVYLPGGTDPVYTYSILAGASGINKSEIDILLGLSETGTLTYKATVTPAQAGTIGEIVFTNNPKLYVWYPEFKLTNETIYLGESTDISDRYEFVKWFALKTGAIPPNYSIDGDDFDYRLSWVSGTAPIDEQDYKPSVDSTFRIDPMIKKYPECVGEDCWVSVVHSTHTNFVSDNREKQTFTIFVKTLKLTITKKVAEDDLDPNQSFVFYITADNGYEKTVVIQGNGSATLVGLPIGTYTVEEDTDWSYRYTADLVSQKTTLSRDKKEDKITVVNTIKTDVPWLSGEHFVINSYDREEEVKD